MSKLSILLDLVPQKLITVYEGPHTLTFIPTPSSLSFGGFFQLFGTSGNQLQLIETFKASPEMVHTNLQDFAVIGGYLYTLGTIGVNLLSKFLTYPYPKFPMNLKTSAGRLYFIPTNPT